jgi:antitoxin component YwqK of YwqJK toxin-antitoxin module
MLTLEIKQPKRIQWLTTNGFFHNLLSQAHISWYKNGQKRYEEYYVYIKYHRDPNLGPARTYWYDDGQKSYEAYYLHDKFHRDPNLGPASNWYENGQKSSEYYYVNGEEVNKPC